MADRTIKMIGLDCDGTLLTDQKKLTPYSKSILLKAIEKGVIVLPATGRPLNGVPKEVMELPGIRYALTSNGARIVDVKEQKVLHEETMPLETAYALLDIFGKYDTYKEVFIDGVGYSDAKELERVVRFTQNESVARYMTETRRPVRNLLLKLQAENCPVDKVHAIFYHLEEREKALEEVRNLPGTEPTFAMHNSIEVNQEGVNKGLGLLKLGKILGISREEIMACGDGMNDRAMLQEVGFGVAVANAIDEVKEVADYITDSNEEDGVAKAIHQFVLGGK